MSEAVAQPLLAIEGLDIGFGAGRPPTVDGIDLTLVRGEIAALVGESGSGKSLLAHTIAGILTPSARFDAKRFDFGGVNLLKDPRRAWRSLRGREIGVVFQNPRAALNPVRRIGNQLADVIREHRGLPAGEIDQAVVAALASVRIPEPAARAHAYPSELSGGMCQRVMIAIALAGNPSLLIADEPTTGLDTTTQAAILDLILDHAKARRMATLFITHDLALARAYAERIIVMHAGQIVEEAPAATLFASPRHPYSAALIEATPSRATNVAGLNGIPGSASAAAADACRFAPRCGRSIPRCHDEKPLRTATVAGGAACWVPL